MPEVITFLSPKGGSGAGFCCAGIWRALAENSVRVLAADACFDKCTLDYALGFTGDYVYTMTDVTEGNCTLTEALCNNGSGSFIRFDYEREDFDTAGAFEAIARSDFDYVLVDVTDRDEEFLSCVLDHTDTLVYVTGPGDASIKLTELAIQKYDFDNSCVIVNKIIPSYIQKKLHLTIDEILDNLCCPLLGLVPWSPEAEIIMKQGICFGVEDRTLGDAFSNIARRICGSRVRAADIKKVYDCFKLGRNFKIKKD